VDATPDGEDARPAHDQQVPALLLSLIVEGASRRRRRRPPSRGKQRAIALRSDASAQVPSLRAPATDELRHRGGRAVRLLHPRLAGVSVGRLQHHVAPPIGTNASTSREPISPSAVTPGFVPTRYDSVGVRGSRFAIANAEVAPAALSTSGHGSVAVALAQKRPSGADCPAHTRKSPNPTVMVDFAALPGESASAMPPTRLSRSAGSGTSTLASATPPSGKSAPARTDAPGVPDPRGSKRLAGPRRDTCSVRKGHSRRASTGGPTRLHCAPCRSRLSVSGHAWPLVSRRRLRHHDRDRVCPAAGTGHGDADVSRSSSGCVVVEVCGCVSRCP
jgi:hypothetical protein